MYRLLLVFVLVACTNNTEQKYPSTETMQAGLYPDTAMREQMLGYIEWITARSDLVYKGEQLPLLVYFDRDHLSAINMDAMYVGYVYGDRIFSQLLLPRGTLSAEDNSKIVHEMVHYLQAMNGRFVTDSCLQIETEAYRLQQEWINEHHQRDWRYSINGLGLSVATCERLSGVWSTER